MATIGFIGLGNMGAPMATNLLKRGHNVSVFDISQKTMDKFAVTGSKKTNSAFEATVDADFIISMLPTGKSVWELYLGSNGLLRESKLRGATIIDSSTIECAIAKDLALEASSVGIKFIDAPVSGGVAGAVSASLAFMVGSSLVDFETVKPILKCMGKNVFHAGGSGLGQTAKACNNMLLGIIMAGTSETLNLGARNGLDPKVLSNIMKESTGTNWALRSYNPVPGVMEDVPSSNDYNGGFQVSLMLKDLGIASALANDSETPIPLGSQANALYRLHESGDFGKLDFSSIFQFYKNE